MQLRASVPRTSTRQHTSNCSEWAVWWTEAEQRQRSTRRPVDPCALTVPLECQDETSGELDQYEPPPCSCNAGCRLAATRSVCPSGCSHTFFVFSSFFCFFLRFFFFFVCETRVSLAAFCCCPSIRSPTDLLDMLCVDCSSFCQRRDDASAAAGWSSRTTAERLPQSRWAGWSARLGSFSSARSTQPSLDQRVLIDEMNAPSAIRSMEESPIGVGSSRHNPQAS